MTATAPAPTHPGPGPKPGGPTHPTPTGPPTRALAAIDSLLVSALAIATTVLPKATDRVEICGQEILAFRLRRARAAVADLAAYTESPARQSVFPLAAVGAITDGPVRPPNALGEEPTPGSAVALAGAARTSDGAVVAPVAGAIHWRCGTAHDRAVPCPPEMPGTSELAARVAADFRLPREVRPLVESLNRRAD